MGVLPLETLVTVLHILMAVALIASILLQSGRAAGLSGAITGGSEAVFGKKKGLDELLGRATAILAAVFFITSTYLTWRQG